MIKIARPVDLMPLHSETKKIDVSVKKSQTLPLFGKRGTFKYSTVTMEPKSANPIQPTYDNRSDEEEVEEMDDKEATEKDVLPVDDPKVSDDEQTNTRPSSVRLICSPPKQDEKPPDTVPEEAQDRIADPETVEDNRKSIVTNGRDSSSSISSSSTITKKKRNRIRIRNDKGRENVDFDEEMVDTEKYSTWVPPQGQSGDGSTNLNDKYGY